MPDPNPVRAFLEQIASPAVDAATRDLGAAFADLTAGLTAGLCMADLPSAENHVAALPRIHYADHLHGRNADA